MEKINKRALSLWIDKGRVYFNKVLHNRKQQIEAISITDAANRKDSENVHIFKVDTEPGKGGEITKMYSFPFPIGTQMIFYRKGGFSGDNIYSAEEKDSTAIMVVFRQEANLFTMLNISVRTYETGIVSMYLDFPDEDIAGSAPRTEISSSFSTVHAVEAVGNISTFGSKNRISLKSAEKILNLQINSINGLIRTPSGYAIKTDLITAQNNLP